MNILLTGATGLIGGELKKQLIQHFKSTDEDVTLYCISQKKTKENQVFETSDYRFAPILSVVHYGGNLLDESYVKTLLKSTAPTYIFHLAAKATVKEETQGELFEKNLLMTEYLLRHAPQGCRFVYASSATVYGSYKDVDSRGFEESDLPNPSSIYAATKLASEALIQARHNLGQINGLILRFIANVGVNARHGILKDFIQKAKSDNPIFEVLGNKPSYKPYILVEDTAQVALKLAFKGCSGIYNIGTCNPLYSDQVARIVMEELGVNKEIKFVGGNWPGDDRFVKVSFNKAYKEGCDLKCWYSDKVIRKVVQEYKNS